MMNEAALSPSRCMTLRGLQNFITRTITAIHVNELAISVSSGPMKFDTVNCIPANDKPHAIIAGATSSARRPPAITTMR